MNNPAASPTGDRAAVIRPGADDLTHAPSGDDCPTVPAGTRDRRDDPVDAGRPAGAERPRASLLGIVRQSAGAALFAKDGDR